MAVVALLSTGAEAARAAPKPPTSLSASSWILVDADSGDLLTARDETEALPVASATKLMTYYVAREKLSPEREIVAAPYKAEAGESLAGLEPGDSLLARDVFYGLLVASGNDAAVTLSLAASGSEADFVSRMNASADDLGLSESEFFDPIGISAGNAASAQDLVDLTLELRDDPLFRQIVDTPEITLRSGADPLQLENRNTLVLSEPFVDGVKTGTTLEAGYTLVGSGERKGVELVSAVLGSPDAASRDAATLELLDYGFSLYRERTLVEQGQSLGSVSVEGLGERLSVEAATSVSEVARTDQQVDFDLENIAPVSGSIARGDPVGSVVVRLEGQEIAQVEALATRAVSTRDSDADNDGRMPTWAWLVFAGATLVSAMLGAVAIGVHRRG